MAHDAWLDDLARVPLFADCAKKDLQQIASASVEVDLQPGRVLARQGEAGHECFVIIDGTASVTRDGETLATLTAGDVVGELALLTGAPRLATISADTRLTVRVIGQREFTPLLEEVPGLAVQILRNLATRLTEIEAAALQRSRDQG